MPGLRSLARSGRVGLNISVKLLAAKLQQLAQTGRLANIEEATSDDGLTVQKVSEQ